MINGCGDDFDHDVDSGFMPRPWLYEKNDDAKYDDNEFDFGEDEIDEDLQNDDHELKKTRKMTKSDHEIVDKIIADATSIEKRYFNKKGGKVMEQQTNPTPMGGYEQANPSGGDQKKAQRIIELMLELRKARETIESQLTEIKSQAKSKVSALRGSENALLDALEEKDQMTLFEVDPSVSDEVQKIIANPTI